MPRRVKVLGALLTAAMLGAPLGRSAQAGEEPVTAPDPDKRRAVRGVSLAAESGRETPELRALHDYERSAFSRATGVPVGAKAPLSRTLTGPPGLGGDWHGSGDVPPVLRSHAYSERQDKADDGTQAWLSGLKLPQLPVRWDDKLIRYLDYFKNDSRGRAIMASWLRRLGRYRAPFESILRTHGLPTDLVYLAMIESGFSTGAVSGVGAQGIWQFMKGAGRAYGLEDGHWGDARRDPESAAKAPGRYLKDFHAGFGAWDLAFAADNPG